MLRSTFIPKNGYKAGMAPTGPGQASPAVVTQTVTTPTPTFSPTDNQFAAAQVSSLRIPKHCYKWILEATYIDIIDILYNQTISIKHNLTLNK